MRRADSATCWTARRTLLIWIASMPGPVSQGDLSYSRFQAMLDAFEREPSIANYVRFRRAFGVSGSDIARFTEFDPLSIGIELRQFGIDPWVVSAALDGDDRQIDEMALQLMEAIIEGEKLERDGVTHAQSRRLVISDSLVDFLIIGALEATQVDAVAVPPSLIVLIRERLCGATPDRYKEHLRTQRRRDAVALAALRFPRGQVSIRRIAALMHVQPSTVTRWFPDGDFQEQVDRFRKSIDALGLRKKRATK